MNVGPRLLIRSCDLLNMELPPATTQVGSSSSAAEAPIRECPEFAGHGSFPHEFRPHTNSAQEGDRSNVSSQELFGSANGWLSSAEFDELARLRDARRRREWLAGRWLLKDVLHRNLNGARPEEIEILSRDALGRGQPPRVLLAGRLLLWHVSLAHHGGHVWAAVSTDPGIRVGIDVVSAESVGGWISDLWFSAAELRWLDSSKDRLLGPTLWAIKEAVYKATNRGEPFAPARIRIEPDAAGGFTWSCDGIPCGSGDWISVRRTDDCIIVVASRRTAASESKPAIEDNLCR